MPRAHLKALHYVFVYLVLVALGLLTFGLSFVHLGPYDVVISLAIAVAKSLLVALFFMHLIEQPFAMRLAPAVAILLVTILVALTATDVATRHGLGPPN